MTRRDGTRSDREGQERMSIGRDRTGQDGVGRDRTDRDARSDRDGQEGTPIGREMTGQDGMGRDGTDRDRTRSDREIVQERTSMGRDRIGLKSCGLTSSQQLFYHFARKTTSQVELFAQ